MSRRLRGVACSVIDRPQSGLPLDDDSASPPQAVALIPSAALVGYARARGFDEPTFH